MLGLGLRLGTVATLLARLPAIAGSLPGTRLALSSPITRNVAIGAGVVLLGASPASTFTTTISGLTINNATRAVTGTPTARCGLVTEHFTDGTSRNSLLFAPDGGNRHMKLGINVGFINYYTPNAAFLDFLKTGERHTNGGTYNANGFPQTLGQDNNGVTADDILVALDSGLAAPVKYRIITDGDIDAEMRAFGDAGQPIAATTVMPFTRDGSSNLTVNWTGGGGTQANCSFRVLAIRTAPSFIALVRDDEAAHYLNGETFRPGFVTEMSRFSRIRMMNWSQANSPTYDAIPDGNFSYAAHVPLKVQVDLCIAANADGWFNPHATTSNSAYQAMWPQFDRLIAAGHKAVNELSNEVWNGGFWQASTYAPAQFDALPGTGVYDASTTPSPGPGWIDNFYCKNEFWYGYRAGQLAMLARGRSYQWVIGVQPVNQSGDIYGAAHYLDQGLAFGGGTYSDFYGWIVTTYTSGSWAQSADGIGATRFNALKAIATAGDVDAALDDICNYTGTSSYSTQAAVTGWWAAGKARATERGLKLIAYEGNAATAEDGFPGGTYSAADYAVIDPFLIAMAHHALTAQVVLQSLEAADSLGFDEVEYFDFNSIPTYNSSASGVYGTFGYPSYQGLLTFLAKPYSAT